VLLLLLLLMPIPAARSTVALQDDKQAAQPNAADVACSTSTINAPAVCCYPSAANKCRHQIQRPKAARAPAAAAAAAAIAALLLLWATLAAYNLSAAAIQPSRTVCCAATSSGCRCSWATSAQHSGCIKR
jgi:hypothetical protein